MPTDPVKSLVQRLVGRAGYEIRKRPDRDSPELPTDFDPETVAIVDRVRPHTMTSVERIAAVVSAMKYVDQFRIPGAFVECGVWRGGSSMAAALAHTAADREMWLYDTFEGMPPPTSDDVEHDGRRAAEALAGGDRESSNVWAVAGLDLVRANMRSTGYPTELVHFVAGKVEDTVPGELPSGPIAILRLDTDWYESTRHELEHLVPLVSPGGVLIIDDYGHWQGAKKAVDEWLSARTRPVLLSRTDYTGRVAVLS